jgi:YD repeat-containing protein
VNISLRAYTYDAAGNTLSDSRGAGYSYTYDSAGRMASMSINGVLQGQYKYDFAGRQAIRTLTSTGQTLHSVFDASGNRIADYDQNSGVLLWEYVWNGLTPVAVIEGGAVYFIRTNHIGKPVFATGSLGTTVWQVRYDRLRRPHRLHRNCQHDNSSRTVLRGLPLGATVEMSNSLTA